jgi:hypothetical protein
MKSRMSEGFGTHFRDALKDVLVSANDSHYGRNPEHLGKFQDIETGQWIDIPDRFSPILKEDLIQNEFRVRAPSVIAPRADHQ